MKKITENNKNLGTNFEREFCKILKEKGYWAHFIEPNKTGGQPFDIIACKNGSVIAFDCKTNKGDRFALSRIEDNQELAFVTFSACGNNDCYIAVKNENGIYLLNATDMIWQKRIGTKSVRLQEKWKLSYQIK
ncbi:MAG: Holliday junction resolvase RecU [Clostridia bacterium]|nr:Holliday junction resolvase RecU [Clostridia bacterium]